MTPIVPTLDQSYSIGSPMRRQMRKFTSTALVTMLGVAVVTVFLVPLLFMTSTAFKDKAQLTAPGAPLYPAVPDTFTWEGEDYPVYDVPIDGGVRPLALVEARREESTFVDPAAPEAGLIVWEGRWRSLTQHWRFQLDTRNLGTAWEAIAFPRLLFAIVLVLTIAIFKLVGSRVYEAGGNR